MIIIRLPRPGGGTPTKRERPTVLRKAATWQFAEPPLVRPVRPVRQVTRRHNRTQCHPDPQTYNSIHATLHARTSPCRDLDPLLSSHQPQQEVWNCVLRAERSERLDPTCPQECGLGGSWSLQRRFFANRARYMRSALILPHRQLEV